MKVRLLTAVVFLALTALVSAQTPSTPAGQLRSAINRETIDGDVAGAIQQYKDIVAKYPTNQEVAAGALMRLAALYEKQGSAEARVTYRRIVNEYANTGAIAAAARAKLQELGVERSSADPFGRPWWTKSKNPLPARPGYTKTAADGVFSPDGRYMLFNDGFPDQGSIGILELSSGRITNILPDTAEANVIGQAWMPDSRRLIYNLNHRKSRAQELRVVDISGANDRVVLTRPFGTPWISGVLPDGKNAVLITYDSAATGSMFELVNIETKATRTIKRFPRRIGSARLSPDGKWIAYTCCDDPGTTIADEVMMFSVETGEERNLTLNPSRDMLLGWTPAGGILFVSNRSGVNDLWLLPSANGEVGGFPQKLRRNIGPVAPYAVGTDGSLYYRVGPSAEIWTAEFNDAGTVTAPPAVVSLGGMSTNRLPVWSPDGKRLAYLSAPGVGRALALMILNAETGQEKQLTPQIAPLIGGVSWAPDGRSLVASVDAGLVRIDAADGTMTTLIARPETAKPLWLTNPRWLPSGDAVVSFRNHKSIVIHTLATHSDRVLYDAGEGLSVSGLAIAPSGREVAFIERHETTRASNIKIIPAAGGPARVVRAMRGEVSPQMPQLVWEANGRSLLLVVHEDGPRSTVVRVDAASGGIRETGLTRKDMMMTVSPHPDGRRLAFNSSREDNEPGIYVLEKFLPASELKRK